MNLVKKCSKCQQVKNLNNFGILRKSKDGYRTVCKDCRKIETVENKERISEYKRKYYLENREHINRKTKLYYKKDIEKNRFRRREYYKNHKEESKRYNKIHKEERKAYMKKWESEHKEERKEYRRKQYAKNRERNIEKNRKWKEEHKEHVREYSREYVKRKKEEDSLYYLTTRIRKMVSKVIHKNGYTKKSKTFKILGCSFDFLMNYLFDNAKKRYINFTEQDFLIKGKYHIDHIVPLSTATNEDELIKLNHYMNLQLLTAKDNLKKSNNIKE